MRPIKEITCEDLADYVPAEIGHVDNPQTAIPRIAKDERLVRSIEASVQRVPTSHELHMGDARDTEIQPGSVHLIVTSPPYWTLKEYRHSPGQMGHIEKYEEFLTELDTVWKRCHVALVPGGRLVCVVGDVCLSRRKNAGRHTVVPLHASIQERCRMIGYDNLAPIIWYKIANATDLWAAYREGAFKPSQRPWLGYLVLLEESPASTKAVDVWEPYFRVFPSSKTHLTCSETSCC